jgi:tetratricopeptide (TPR) repeat protein
MIRSAALLGLILMVPTLSAARGGGVDAEFDSLAGRGIDHVYNLEFEAAESEFSRLITLKPHHPAGHFFSAMVLWWRILIDIENEQYDDEFLEALDRVIVMCDSLLDVDESDVTAIFFKGGAIGFQGRLQFHRNDYFSAADAGRRALPLVQIASTLDPNNHDILLGAGIYNYYAEVIPDQYPYLKPLLLFVPAGDRQKGLAQLALAAEKGKYASVESSYFLMQAYYFYEHDYARALAVALRLTARFPNNMLFQRYLGRCFISLNNWERGRGVFADIADRAQRGVRGYTEVSEREATYYLGMYEMNRRSYEKALEHFYRCDALSRGLDRTRASGFMVMANLKIGMIYDKLSRRDLATNQYEKVLEMHEFRNSHEEAERYLNSPFVN